MTNPHPLAHVVIPVPKFELQATAFAAQFPKLFVGSQVPQNPAKHTGETP